MGKGKDNNRGDIMQCPDCKTKMDWIDDKPSESMEMYDVKVYQCPKCGVELDGEEI